MTVEEKAQDLIDKYMAVLDTPSVPLAKRLALVAVDEIVRLAQRPDLFLMKTKFEMLTGFIPNETYYEYWRDVRALLIKE